MREINLDCTSTALALIEELISLKRYISKCIGFSSTSYCVTLGLNIMQLYYQVRLNVSRTSKLG